MSDDFDPLPDHDLARQLAGAFEAFRPVLTRWRWHLREGEITAALGFVGGDSVIVVLDPAQGRVVFDVWVGNAPCTVDALVKLLAVNFNTLWKTRVAQYDAREAVVCLEALLPLDYGLTHARTLVQAGVAQGLRRRGALAQLWGRVEEQAEKQDVGLSA